MDRDVGVAKGKAGQVRKPHFLIVGAMKGGTTTLFYDLGRHPDLYMPDPKEPEILVRETGAAAILAAYDYHFRAARPGQRCGEGSTAYTKRPDHEDVARIAHDALGPDVRILYMTRDPVARAVSHYLHDRQHGMVGPGFAEAVRTHPRYCDYGRYAWQIAPWREAFGDANVLEVALESYSADRIAWLDRICAFLGVDPARLGPVDTAFKANSAQDQKAIDQPLLRLAVESRLYQNVVKGLLPRALRERVRRAVLPSAEVEQVTVEPELRRFILERAGGVPT